VDYYKRIYANKHQKLSNVFPRATANYVVCVFCYLVL